MMPAMPNGAHGGEPSPYVELDRAAWAELGDQMDQPLSAEEITRLRGLGDQLDLDEVEQVYLPLSRLLSLRVKAARRLHRKQEEFLHRPQPPRTPFVIGLAGSVAVGKSTTARVLQQMLAHWDEHPNVALVTTDGFLYPNAELERRGILQRKGFPESYNRRALLRFVAEVKAGRAEVSASLYVDARIEHSRAWYIARFLRLRQTAFADPHSYFHRYAVLSDEEARATAA